MGSGNYGIDPNRLSAYASEIKAVVDNNAQVAIVIGGGNIYRGMRAEKMGIDRVQGDYMGMLATVMNGIALRDALERAGVKTRVMSAISMSGVAEHYDRRLAIQLLSKYFDLVVNATDIFLDKNLTCQTPRSIFQ